MAVWVRKDVIFATARPITSLTRAPFPRNIGLKAAALASFRKRQAAGHLEREIAELDDAKGDTL